jgi:hypothetical protein
MRTTLLRVGLAVFAGTLLQGVARAQSADEGLVECTHVAEKNARLRCYDDRMTRLGHKVGVEAPAAAKSESAVAKSASAPSTAAAVASSAPPPSPSSKPTEFGASPEMLRKQRQAEGPAAKESPPELVAQVRSVSELAHGELRIELENDQVWIETQHWANNRPLAAGETVTIKHGTLGSFFLTRQSGPALRVKRIH